MPVGLGGAAFMRNLPSAGGYTANVNLFNQETERNDVPLTPVTYPGLGGAMQSIRLPNNGILSSIALVFKGSLVVATSAATSGYQWPWNIVKRVQLNANGQTSLIAAEGMDMRVRRQRLYRNPREELSNCIGTDTVGTVQQTSAAGNPIPQSIAVGTYTITLEWTVPVTHDEESITGALFAQSDQNYLQLNVYPAAQTDLFTTAGTVSLTGTIYPTVTFFDIPIVSTSQGDQVIIPDLSWLHGFLSADNPFSNTSDVYTSLIRTDGQMLALLAYLDNGSQAQIAPTALNEIRFEYGGNRKPRVFNPPEQLLAKNVRDYNGLLKPNYFCLDFEGDNPARDLVYPKGVSELKIAVNIPTGTSLNAGSHVHFVEDTLFAGV